MSQAKKKNTKMAWVALVDSVRCRLLCCTFTKAGTHHVQELGVLHHIWPMRERSALIAPDNLTINSPSLPLDHVTAQIREFTNKVFSWLNTECTERQVERLVIIAVPNMLDELRKPLDSSNGRFELRQGCLTQLSTSTLSVHPLIRSLTEDSGARKGPTASIKNDLPFES